MTTRTLDRAGPSSTTGTWAFICLAIPAAVLAVSYAWLVADHGSPWLWNVVVHESGHYTLGETVLYFSHFLREVPTLLAYSLFLLGASGAVGSERPRLSGDGSGLGSALLLGAAILVGGALLWTALADGLSSALADLLQFRTRDDQVGYGTHWRFHWLSTLWFGAAVGLAPTAASRLARTPALLPNRFWTTGAWAYFAALTIIFGLSENVFLDLHYVGHQAREILTHGPVTLLLGLGVLLAFGGRGAEQVGPAGRAPVLTPWVFGALFVGIPIYLLGVSLSGDVLAHGQPQLGLSAMVAAHFFEHVLDYVLVILLVTGTLSLMKSPTLDPAAVESHPSQEQPSATLIVGEEESHLDVLPEAVTVVIPAFNEGRYVAQQIRDVSEVMDQTSWQYEIIVVDDGSIDGTGASALAEGVRVLRNRRNRGYGASLKRGIAAAQHDWIIIIDADGTYPPSAIPRLLALGEMNEMVVGARITQNRKIPLVRRPAKWFLTRLASYLARRPLPDLNSGLRLIRRNLVDRYVYLLPSGFSFTTTITLAAASNDHEVAYVPIDYHARVGESKIRPGHAVDFLLLVLRIIVFFNPLRVFVPIGATLAVLGLAKLAYDLTLQNISESALLGLLGALVVWAVGLLADQNATIARRK